MTPAFQNLMQRALDAARRDALEQSEALLVQAAAMAPGAAMPHFLRAGNFAQAGRHELAEASYIACLTRAPDFALARFQLGLLQLVDGRPAVARASWEPLLGLPQEHFLKLFAQGLLAALAGDAARARERIERGIAANSENAPLNDDLRALLARLGSAHAGVPQARMPAEVRAGAVDAPEAGSHFLIGGYRVH